LHKLLITTPLHLQYVATLPCNLSSMARFADINVSQGSVATYARCGGILNIHLTTNSPKNLPVKKKLKSVKIWQNYESVASLFWPTLWRKIDVKNIHQSVSACAAELCTTDNELHASTATISAKHLMDYRRQSDSYCHNFVTHHPGLHQPVCMSQSQQSTGNESVPKITINNTINSFLNCNQHFGYLKP